MPITSFDDIQYLASGAPRQQQAYQLLTQYQLINLLAEFDPILAGTIPINIDIENSDLDIICCFADKEHFRLKTTSAFAYLPDFHVTDTLVHGQETVVANFSVEGWPVEVFGQYIPTRQQNAYGHMLVEYELLAQFGEPFRQEVIRLKNEGYKTEPAFAHLLGLAGDPYLGLLKPDLMDRLKNK